MSAIPTSSTAERRPRGQAVASIGPPAGYVSTTQEGAWALIRSVASLQKTSWGSKPSSCPSSPDGSRRNTSTPGRFTAMEWARTWLYIVGAMTISTRMVPASSPRGRKRRNRQQLHTLHHLLCNRVRGRVILRSSQARRSEKFAPGLLGWHHALGKGSAGKRVAQGEEKKYVHRGEQGRLQPNGRSDRHSRLRRLRGADDSRAGPGVQARHS